MQVKHKQRRAKPIGEDLPKTQVYESYERPAEQQQPSHITPPLPQPAALEEPRHVETKPAPWAKAAPSAKPGKHATVLAQCLVSATMYAVLKIHGWECVWSRYATDSRGECRTKKSAGNSA